MIIKRKENIPKPYSIDFILGDTVQYQAKNNYFEFPFDILFCTEDGIHFFIWRENCFCSPFTDLCLSDMI